MRALQNPFIIKLKGVYESKNSLYLVLEYLTGKSLRHRIDSRLGKFFKN
jgi:serine/threonine protein kinase